MSSLSPLSSRIDAKLALLEQQHGTVRAAVNNGDTYQTTHSSDAAANTQQLPTDSFLLDPAVAELYDSARNNWLYEWAASREEAAERLATPAPKQAGEWNTLVDGAAANRLHGLSLSVSFMLTYFDVVHTPRPFVFV